MIRGDFTKTSNQVNEEIGSLIADIQRSLDVSQGETDRKGQAVFSVVLSIVLFLCILGFSSFLKTQQPNEGKAVLNSSIETTLSRHDKAQLESYVARIDQQLDSIQMIKSRVAPSMLIDPQINAIRDIANDVRTLLDLARKSDAASLTPGNQNSQ